MYRRRRRTFDIQENALYSYLPVFTAKYFRSPDNADIVIDDWILGNPEISRNYWNPLQEDLLREVFYFILDAVAAADSGEVVHSTSRRLLRELEIHFHEDDAPSMLGGLQVSRHSQHFFRSLAEISHSSRSPHIGTVLYTFFLDHVKQIARRDSVRSLVQWCHAILRSHMREDDKATCLEKLLSLRPELIEELEREPGNKARKVAECLSDLELEFGHSGLLTSDLQLRAPRSRPRVRIDDVDDRIGLLELDAEDERYARQLRADIRYHEDAADRKSRKMLQLEMGTRTPRLLTLEDEFDDLRPTRRRSKRLLRERDSLESIRWTSRPLDDDLLAEQWLLGK